MSKSAFRGLVMILLGAALAFRLPGLALRPMHHDEANQAVKFGLLLEKGEYTYDPTDHHGPSLYYLTWPLAAALSQRTLADLEETTLRLLPVLFGSGIIVILLFFARGIGRPAVLMAGLLTALSPVFTFYSRFYIQEALFVFFCLGFIGAIWTYRERPSGTLAVPIGLFAGLMYATKETSIILFATVAGAWVLTRAVRVRQRGNLSPFKLKNGAPAHIVLAAGTAILIAALFFSSFLKNPKGMIDSFLAFQSYVTKSGDPGFHAHPWWYYFGLLTYSKSGGLVWSESLVLALAALGVLAAIKKRRELPVFFSFFALLTAAVFSVISYKTPWNLLPFYSGLMILAGTGTDFLFRSLRSKPLKVVAGLVLASGLVQLGWQNVQANQRYCADPRNPYVYAQTSPDFLKLVKRVEEIAALHPERTGLLIKVVAGPYETWPLPWSLRRFSRVGYWESPETTGGFDDVPIVIASEDRSEKIRPHLRDGYQSEYYGLRPDVLLTLFIRNDLWDRYLKDRGR